MRLYSRIVDRLAMTIKGRKVSNIEHPANEQSLNKEGTPRVAVAELNQKSIGEYYE
jgi:hypothetical protein